MRFTDLHKLTSYLMVLAAILSLVSSPEISLWTTVLSLGGTVASWFMDPLRHKLARFNAAWNIATVIFFFYLVTDVLRGGSVIIAGAHFLLFVLVNKLFNRQTSADYLQAYVVSFLLLVVATTLNTDISYAVCFAAYCLFCTWTLSLFHLRRDMEENYLLTHSEEARSEKVEVERILNSRRIVGRSFLLGTSLIWIGILLGSVLVFALFPRIGLGFFIGQKRGGIALAGFRERVELGHHGLIRDNPSVVMRVMMPGGDPQGKLRWRGSAFDHYEEGSWSHSPELMGKTQGVVAHDDLYVLNHAPGLPPRVTPHAIRETLLRQEIYLEPIDTTVLFAADRPVAIERQRALVGRKPSVIPRRGPLSEIRNGAPRSVGVRYVAYSHLRQPSPTVLRQAVPLEDQRLSGYLQLPLHLPPRIGDLARRITRDKHTIYDRVMAIQSYLQRHYAYTLQLTHKPDREPVDEFLFETKRGHCEYFASAMTLMLRHLGIHSRSVNGFAGGEWNRYGNYLAVRQGDAHAWLEVLFSNVGWVTFDPTPVSHQTAATAAGLSQRLRQILDTVRMRWFQYVVEYDLRRQISLFKELQRLMTPTPKPQATSWLVRYRTTLLVLGALVILGGLWWLWRRRRRRFAGSEGRSPAAPPRAALVYHRFLVLMRRAGHNKPSGNTPLEFVDALARKRFPALELARRFTHCYYDLRYSGLTAEPERQQELSTLLKQLQQALQPRS